MDKLPLRLLVAVGSRSDEVCSIGAFSRAEAKALKDVFQEVRLLEPTIKRRYPVTTGLETPDVIFFHAPSLHDRIRPWYALKSALRLKAKFPRALFVPIVHEFSEAPAHWKLRQIAILQISQGAVVNTHADFEGLKRWNRKILRSQLGPTLFIEELLNQPQEQKIAERIKITRQMLAKLYSLDVEKKWVLHPGLLTPGKGVNFLGKIAPYLGAEGHLILMGGLGPKQRDKDFASTAIEELEIALGDRLTVLTSPDDEIFRAFLLAANLVVLPYDQGLSERRSSFLSSMSCGANVWTTRGIYSAPFEIEKSGVHSVDVAQWAEGAPKAMESIQAALQESEATVLKRRAQNLNWAKRCAWERRAQQIREFITSLR